MADEPVEVVPTKLALAEGRVGAAACDPSYQTGEPSVAPPATKGPPPPPVVWGGLDENVEEHRSLLTSDGSLPPAAPEVRDLPDPTARAGKVPVEFDLVDAPDIELDLPLATPSVKPSIVPVDTLPFASPGPSVLVEGKFFERLPLAFVAPILGKAWALLLFAALVPAFASLLLTLDVGLVLRVVFFVPAFLFSIGLLSEAFSRLAQAGADNDEGVPQPELGDTNLQTILGSGIATVFIAALLFVLPAYLFFIQAINLTAFTALSFLPYLYWPMSLTVQGMTGNVVAGLDMPLVFRSMARAPIKYLVVVALGFILTGALSFGASLAIAGMVIAAGPSRLLVFASTFVFFGTLTYLHGVVGYAMGRLIATEDSLAAALSRR